MFCDVQYMTLLPFLDEGLSWTRWSQARGVGLSAAPRAIKPDRNDRLSNFVSLLPTS